MIRFGEARRASRVPLWLIPLTVAGLLAAAIPAAGSSVVQVAVATGSDDAEESPAGGVSLTSSDLELVTDGTKVQSVGVRFASLGVPPRATIRSARIQFRTDEVGTDAASLTIAAQAADSAPTFQSVSRDVSSRPRTAASVAWTPAPWTTVGEAGVDQRTPDLTAVVAEVVARPGWTEGNAIAFIITGTGRRTADSLEGRYATSLRIEFDPPSLPGPAGVTFTVGGDYGAAATTVASLAAMDAIPHDFHMANGDFAYSDTATEQEWCDFVLARIPALGPAFPFELVVGDAETDSQPKKLVNYVACLPDRLSATLSPTNQFGAEYFFDYPPGAPVIRMIAIGADQKVNGIRYRYLSGNARYTWLAATIDGARTAGIPWVAVAMHEVCQSAGKKACTVGGTLMDLLFAKRVDLILQAHDHNYQRSKQIALDASVCPSAPVGGFDAACVADDGSDDDYLKGAGSVFVINGAFGGRGLSAVSTADPEAGYFAELDSSTRGFSLYTVTATRIEGRFVNSVGSFTDAFVIRAP
ncbi:MAG TPA: hypothetical protein VM841_02410 [Actinomycetota bacterium]|nr:hypothetical protein [Actinomycetota bacterium]